MNKINYTAITPDKAFLKAKNYCAYQERSHTEVKEKLYSFHLKKPVVEELMSKLIEEGYLNEERFARQYAGGKFRMKKWGRVKIIYALKQKRISAYNIKMALEEINAEEYYQTLEKLAAAKWNMLKKIPPVMKKQKLQQYLLQKGYEPLLVKKVISATGRDLFIK